MWYFNTFIKTRSLSSFCIYEPVARFQVHISMTANCPNIIQEKEKNSPYKAGKEAIVTKNETFWVMIAILKESYWYPAVIMFLKSPRFLTNLNLGTLLRIFWNNYFTKISISFIAYGCNVIKTSVCIVFQHGFLTFRIKIQILSSWLWSRCGLVIGLHASRG